MKLYNTLKRVKEEFVPIEEGEVKIYACGPTVYNYIHIGNARPICVFDVLRRYLEYSGFKVTYVQNFTDIDDKIIRKASEEKKDYASISREYINEYLTDSSGLNIHKATFHPLATDNIDEIIKFVSKLIQKGNAYVSENGDVYFSTKSFCNYGKLSHQPLEDLEIGARINVGDKKKDPMDFALWKSAKPGEPMWDSPWGMGRPGWHIECSAMAKRYLGETIDIHCGGQDLIFPHHENEIAQSECANGYLLANYWLHNGYINVDNKKMSKSLNNFFTVREVSERYGYAPIKYLMISSHYRSPISYSENIIIQCRSALERLKNFKNNLNFIIKSEKSLDQEVHSNLFSKYMDAFIKALEDDLNTADALAALFDLVHDVNIRISANSCGMVRDAEQAIKIFNKMTYILGLDKFFDEENELDEYLRHLLERRNEARKNKNWNEADIIRDELKELGYVIEDTSKGTKLKKATN